MVDEEVDQLEQLYVDMFMVIHCFLCFQEVAEPQELVILIQAEGMEED